MKSVPGLLCTVAIVLSSFSESWADDPCCNALFIAIDDLHDGNGVAGDWQVAGWVADHLSREQPQPFFLACGFYRSHLPWHAPQEYFDRFPLGEIILPEVISNDLEDGSEDLYDPFKNPGEHRNLANDRSMGKINQQLRLFLPDEEAPRVKAN